MVTISKVLHQDMGLGPLAQNQASRALFLKLGLKPPHKHGSLASWFDMVMIELFFIPCMDLKASSIVNEGKQGI